MRNSHKRHVGCDKWTLFIQISFMIRHRIYHLSFPLYRKRSIITITWKCYVFDRHVTISQMMKCITYLDSISHIYRFNYFIAKYKNLLINIIRQYSYSIIVKWFGANISTCKLITNTFNKTNNTNIINLSQETFTSHSKRMY